MQDSEQTKVPDGINKLKFLCLSKEDCLSNIERQP